MLIEELNAKSFIGLFNSFFTGVPDSLLSPLCDALLNDNELSQSHIITANEGNAVALAAGYHLATGKIPVVYMQNSGIGNAVNPIASLLNPKIYGIPCVFIIGWRGEPNVYDEPQHLFQGEITLNLLKVLDVDYFVIEKNTSLKEIKKQLEIWNPALMSGKSVAFVVKKGSFANENKIDYKNNYILNREEVISRIAEAAGDGLIVSTTGKISRELYEIRERNGQEHKYDFLTVGSMGHSSSTALGIAENVPYTKVWCLDGDGAALMHMGAMAIIGTKKPKNLIHVVLNNAAHESVGGMPTVADDISFVNIALGCGYPKAFNVSNYAELEQILTDLKKFNELIFIEVKCELNSRENLGRPSTTAKENKNAFMDYINVLKERNW